MKKKLAFLLLWIFFTSISIFSQVVIKGTVIDKDTQEPLIGVTVYDQSSKQGTVTDLDGSFSLKVPSIRDKVIVSYVGYQTKTLNSSVNLGTIELLSEVIGLKDVVVTSSIAIRRKTPVALSVIEPEQIELKLGTQEYPEILKSTPGVYATKQGGGYGDSRINMRGFESPNIAVMINGIPMNDMEWGGLYWSNWAGLSDVTRSMQTQRGLGASKVAAPSVGGSINIVTKSTDATKGGGIYYGMGNNGYNKLGFNVSTGLSDNGWAISLLGSKTWSDGYVLGTEFEAYSYFINISKIINDHHQLSFTAFAAPQWHNQRAYQDKMLVTEWQKFKEKELFNPTYGFTQEGKQMAGNYNYYHKPQISLNHYWTMNEKSSLSTALYLSLGKGGGYGWQGSGPNAASLRNSMYGASNATGLLNTEFRFAGSNYRNYGAIQKMNADPAQSPNGSQLIVSNSRNNHTWVGLLPVYTTKLNSNIDFYGGLDLRYYAGVHDAVIVDLMGGDYFIDTDSRGKVKYKTINGIPANQDPSFVNEKLGVGDIVYRDNTGYVTQEGVFAQAEYTEDKLNVFAAGSFSNVSYWRVDRFYYNDEKSAVGNFPGFTAKGGANYNLTSNHNVFANIGFISRAPFMSGSTSQGTGGYFMSMATSNVSNPDAINEKIFSMELGYGYRSKIFSANLNAYRTAWNDKCLVSSFSFPDDQYGYANLSGADALHQGIEVDFKFKPINNLEITGMLSYGHWQWVNDASGYLFDSNGNPVDSRGNIVDPLSPEHTKVNVNLDGVMVGNSAQSTYALGARYTLLKSLTVGADLTVYDRNYAGWTMATGTTDKSFRTPWMIPSAGIVDFNANYKFKVAGLDAILIGNINNLFDQTYITDAMDLKASNVKEPVDWKKDVAVLYGFGRTFSVALKVNF